jgi:outer membrane biosynthesis protein TonB
MKSKKSNKNKPLIWALSISLLLHLLIVWLLLSGNLLAYILRQPDEVVAEQPLVLEFEDPAPKPQSPQPEPQPEPQKTAQQPLPQKYFQIEDNPNANEQTPENADILAAKASISASPQETQVLNEAIKPRQESEDLTIKETPENKPQEAVESGLNFEEKTGDVAIAYNREFSRNLLTQTPEQVEATKKLSEAPASKTPPQLKDFRGDLVGDVALSTYAWEWAPWVLQLKYAFYEHLFVPRAYSMGLIDGYTEVYLKISKDGKLVEHRLIQTGGHPTLKESTINAFVSSAPWKPLPANFPDEFLELRVRVIYPNLKEYFAKQRQAQSK